MRIFRSLLHFTSLTIMMLAASVSAPMMKADYIYMGGSHTFAPIGEPGHTLRLEGPGHTLMPVNMPAGSRLQFTTLITPPNSQQAGSGVGFALTQKQSADTLYLLLSVPETDQIYETPKLALTLQHSSGKSVTIPLKATPDKCAEGNDAVLTLCAESNGIIRLSGGKHGHTELWSDTLHLPPMAISSIGIAAGHDAKLTAKRAMLITDSADDSLTPTISPIQIDSLTAAAGDPYSGYWTLLDHTFDASLLQPGGDYELALIPTDNGCYDILYIAGATVHPSQWRSGMLKGRLKPTRLAGLYRLSWIDAEHSPLPGEGTLQFTGTDLCVITLPSLNSTLRLHRLRQAVNK